MSDWNKADKELPPYYTPVLCLVKSSCECEHYGQVVMVRFKYEESWVWRLEGSDIIEDKPEVIFWQYLPKNPRGYAANYTERH